MDLYLDLLEDVVDIQVVAYLVDVVRYIQQEVVSLHLDAVDVDIQHEDDEGDAVDIDVVDVVDVVDDHEYEDYILYLVVDHIYDDQVEAVVVLNEVEVDDDHVVDMVDVVDVS